MFEYTWSWTQEDHILASRQTRSHAIGNHLGKALPWLMAIPVALLIFSAAIDRRHSAASILVAAAPWLVILGLWFGLLYWWFPRMTARRLAAQDLSTRAPIRHVISEAGFAVNANGAAITLSWDHIKQVVETPEFLLFYYTNNCAYFTPRRAIPDGELPPLRSLLHRVLGPRARMPDAAPVSVVAGP
jgi:hypothetical protein